MIKRGAKLHCHYFFIQLYRAIVLRYPHEDELATLDSISKWLISLSGFSKLNINHKRSNRKCFVCLPFVEALF